MIQEGFFALYRGLGASLLGIPHVIIQFNMYENLKTNLVKKYNINAEEFTFPVRLARKLKI